MSHQLDRSKNEQYDRFFLGMAYWLVVICNLACRRQICKVDGTLLHV